jgi:hypothetical protein
MRNFCSWPISGLKSLVVDDGYFGMTFECSVRGRSDDEESFPPWMVDVGVWLIYGSARGGRVSTLGGPRKSRQCP